MNEQELISKIIDCYLSNNKGAILKLNEITIEDIQESLDEDLALEFEKINYISFKKNLKNYLVSPHRIQICDKKDIGKIRIERKTTHILIVDNFSLILRYINLELLPGKSYVNDIRKGMVDYYSLWSVEHYNKYLLDLPNGYWIPIDESDMDNFIIQPNIYYIGRDSRFNPRGVSMSDYLNIKALEPYVIRPVNDLSKSLIDKIKEEA